MSKAIKTDAKLYKKTKTVKGVEYESWVARQYHNGRPVESSASTQIEALQRLAQKINDIDSGAIGISNKMTVKRWAYEWLETYKKPVVAQKQYMDYKRTIDNKILPEIGELRLSEIKDVHIQKILNQMQGKSFSRAKKLRDTVRAIFKQARASGLIRNDPAEFVVMPKVTEGTHRSITDFEREHFLKVAKDHRAGLMYKTMLYCGLRTGEVVALDWRHIDFEKHRIYVESAVKSGTDIIGEPKTKAGKRYIPIPDEIYFDLLDVKGDPFNPVFTRPNGKRHNESSRDAAWTSMRAQMDRSMGAVFEKRKAKDGKMRMTKVLSVLASDFVPYCLRHTYCTDLQNKGVPINIAKYLMGHDDISVTASIYTHISEQAIDAAAELINCGEKHGEKKKA